MGKSCHFQNAMPLSGGTFFSLFQESPISFELCFKTQNQNIEKNTQKQPEKNNQKPRNSRKLLRLLLNLAILFNLRSLVISLPYYFLLRNCRSKINGFAQARNSAIYYLGWRICQAPSTKQNQTTRSELWKNPIDNKNTISFSHYPEFLSRQSIALLETLRPIRTFKPTHDPYRTFIISNRNTAVKILISKNSKRNLN